MKRPSRLLLFACIVLALASPQRAAEPAGAACAVAGGKPCIIDLHGSTAPRLSRECTSEPWSRYLRPVLPGKFVDLDENGWWETVVEIALDPARGCGCAQLRIHYAKPITNWTVNLGDSPTSDGYGGDAGTTFDEAELQIQGQTVFVYSASRGEGTPGVGRVLDSPLPPLAGKFLDVEVCDQQVLLEVPGGLAGGGPYRVKLSASVLGGLFAFARPDGGTGKDRGLYAAFNRVVYLPSGAQRRIGTGVRRVELRLGQ